MPLFLRPTTPHDTTLDQLQANETGLQVEMYIPNHEEHEEDLHVPVELIMKTEVKQVQHAVQALTSHPTLPSPWRALIDDSTDYLYYWNSDTKVTQYERPVSKDPPLTLVASQLRPGVSSSMQQPKQQAPLDVPEENTNQNPCQYVGSRSIGNPSIIDSTEFVQEPSIVKHHKQSSVKSGPAASTAEAYRSQHEITVTGDVAPDPFMTFQSTSFPPDILKEIHHASFSAPTPIQAQSWSIVLRGCDIVAIAKTGSGKTVGFLMPGFVVLKRNHNNSKMGPTVLILSPTRELATQIQDEAVKFECNVRMDCEHIYEKEPLHLIRLPENSPSWTGCMRCLAYNRN
ncbi:DEAD-box ATP-dependent RNA helicase 14-like [Zingiber officinale]|uniref:DEAD-box ATP-dependent RNA helicase 14-like n=1 Tax=Zingiber officinale TaxID=94328 RepID=UPI001C4DD1DE|nr:DEAD-box ATP-dependent RNA helicase 14-like [Zingiber officinale]